MTGRAPEVADQRIRVGSHDVRTSVDNGTEDTSNMRVSLPRLDGRNSITVGPVSQMSPRGDGKPVKFSQFVTMQH